MTPTDRENMYETAWRWSIALGSSAMLLGIGIIIRGQGEMGDAIARAENERVSQDARIRSLEQWGPLSGERVTAKDLSGIQASVLTISTQVSDIREAVARIDERTGRP